MLRLFAGLLRSLRVIAVQTLVLVAAMYRIKLLENEKEQERVRRQETERQ